MSRLRPDDGDGTEDAVQKSSVRERGRGGGGGGLAGGWFCSPRVRGGCRARAAINLFQKALLSVVRASCAWHAR